MLDHDGDLNKSQIVTKDGSHKDHLTRPEPLTDNDVVSQCFLLEEIIHKLDSLSKEVQFLTFDRLI